MSPLLRPILSGVVALFSLAYAQAQQPDICVDYHFGTRANDPIWPQAIGRIAVGPDDSLYTTSTNGGARNLGTIFKVSTSGELTVLWEFDGSVDKKGGDCRKGLPTDLSDGYLCGTGAGPQGGLIDGQDGHFYGTTYTGGQFGVGTLFRISYTQKAGEPPEVLHHFRNGSVLGLWPDPYPCPPLLSCPYSPRQRADISASYPISAPVMGSDGNLHGVTTYSNNQQYGAVYQLSPVGGEKTFHVTCLFQPNLALDKDMKQFVCAPKGNNAAVLIRGKEPSTYYGTTYGGYGTVFKFVGGAVTTLHEFQNKDGSKPMDLMQASDGALYGTTLGGGIANWGVIYRIEPATGEFKVIHEFNAASPSGGAVPVAGLAEGRDGSLFGVTRYNGQYGRGVTFRVKKDGSDFLPLHSFNFYGTGRSPITTPALAGGDLYGTTYQGGKFDKGVFYHFTPPGQPMFTCEGSCQSNHWDNQWVEVRTGVGAAQAGNCVVTPARFTDCDGQEVTRNVGNQACPIKDGISIRVKCARGHVVQFISREYWRVDGSLEAGQYGVSNPANPSQLACFDKTTDARNPKWRTDSRGKPNPYYESGGGYVTTCSAMTTFDAPSIEYDPKKYQAVRARGKSFAVCGGKVVAVVDWRREKFAGSPPDEPPIYNVEPPRDPTPAELAQFQAQSSTEGFKPWPLMH